MNNFKHTKGPWRLNEFHVNREGLTVCELVTNDNSKRIARIDGHVLDSCKASNEAKANARLIAAAPEMLEALKFLKASLTAKRTEDACHITLAMAQKMNAAIAKATGGDE